MHRLLMSVLLIVLTASPAAAAWMRLSGPTPPPVSEILQHGDRWLLGTDQSDQGDMFLSDDGARTWRDAGFPNGGVSALIAHQGVLWAGVYLGGLHRSDDGGETWNQVLLDGSNFVSVEALLAVDAQTFLAGLDRGFGDALQRSTDGGATWQALIAGPDLRCYDLALVDGVILAGGEDQGVWRSDDGGTSWSASLAGLPAMADVHRFAVRDSTVFAAAESVDAPLAVYRSDDRGLTWQAVSTGLPDPLGDTARVLTFHDGALYLAADGHWGARGLYRSTDDGVTWTRLSDTLPAEHPGVRALAFPDGGILLGSHEGAFRSSDDGATWTPSWRGASGVCGGHDALEVNGRLLVGNDARTVSGIQSTTDDGATWTAAAGESARGPTRDFLLHDGIVYAAMGSHGRGVAASTDGGLSFGPVAQGFSFSTVLQCLAVHDDVLFAGAWEGLYRSVDGGAVWTLSPEPGTVFDLVVHQDALHAGLYPGGVVRSDDGGLSWTPVGAGLDDAHINALAVFGGTLYAAVNSHDVLRLDAGAWVPTGLDDAYPIALLAVDGVLLAAASGGRVWATTDGAAWTPFTDNLTAGILEGLALTPESVVAIGRSRGFWTRPRSELPAATAVEAAPAAGVAVSAVPNPFNPGTELRFSRPTPVPAVLTLHDTAGRRVRRVLVPTGTATWRWNGKNDGGRPVPTGLYLARLIAAGQISTAKITLLR